MADQAEGLRRLFPARSGPTALAEPPPRRAPAPPRARSLVFTSGKGGVGTSNLTLNLAIALGEEGQRVVLVDADLGLANIDLLCGLSPPSDLGDVLAGERSLVEAVVSGPGGIQIVPGAHGLRTLVEVLDEAPSRLAAELAELEAGTDFVLVDAGSGLGPATVPLASAADQVVVVTTPEPTAVADAHAVLQRLKRLASPPRLRAIVTQAHSAREAGDVLARLAATSREFLGAVVTPMGHVRADARVPRAVRSRRPFLVASPRCAAARDVRRLARALIAERQPKAKGHQPRVLAALSARWALG
jgi:flagellar biosynthesis protein FlhG